MWWRCFCDLMSELSTKIKLQKIHRLALDATSGTVLLANQHGETISQALMYNDSRASTEATELRQLVPHNTLLHSTSSGIAKMIWLQRHVQPNKSDKYLHQADWLVGQLTGNYTITDCNNALKSGVDLNTNQWPSWISQFGIQPQQLPSVCAPGTTVGLIRDSLAAEFGFSRDLCIVTGTTDSTAAAMATGTKKIGDAITSLGSTLVVKVVSDVAISNSKYGIYSQPYNGHYLVGGGSNSGGAVLAHYFTKTQMQQMSQVINPNITTGLNYYPLLQKGERFPVNDANYPARLVPRPKDDVEFFKAMLEGIADIEYQCYQRLIDIGCPEVHQIISVGGGSHNSVWTQIRQLKLQIPLLAADNSEAAYGVALLALLSAQSEL